MCLAMVAGAAGQKQKPNVISRYDRSGAHLMLRQVYEGLRDYYYDPRFHGVNIEQRYKVYDQKLKQVKTLGEAYRVIDAYLTVLHDSHTYFYPPGMNFIPLYGFSMRMIGNRCFITHVRPGTDAAAKLRPGDEILTLNGYSVNRGDFQALDYFLHILSPQGGLYLHLRGADGAERQEAVRTQFLYRRNIPTNFRQATLGKQQWKLVGGVLVWKFPGFDNDRDQTNRALRAARNTSAIVLDLRGNGGGAVASLQYLLGHFVGRKTLLATLVGRHGRKPVYIQPQKPRYTGKLFVLINSESASAAELFARVVQLNHIGTVVGDRSSGMVMEAYDLGFAYGLASTAFYGLSVTINDVVMADGHSLEGVGVTPGVTVLPSAADLAAGRDPALAQAVGLAGGAITPVAAGQLFPYVWPLFLPATPKARKHP